MKIAIISNEFPPLMSSGAVQIRDLARELSGNGHDVTVITATYGLKKAYSIEQTHEYTIFRTSAFRSKDVGFVRRTLSEIFTPLKMVREIKKSPIVNIKWDGVIWYSPTIFLGPVAQFLKKRSNCRGYLIVRDIFPKWAVDTGLINEGVAYKILQLFEKYQYSVADIIGVQTKGSLQYFLEWDKKPNNKLEVLHNWLSHSGNKPSSICIKSSKLSGRKIFIYAGNMGLAQGMEILFQLVLSLIGRKDIGFVFVGRGSQMERYSQDPAFNSADNILFFDQIHADEIPSLFDQCHVGMLSLDVRHTTHNIPGKFLSYLASGLPVLASVNPGNDIVELIEKNNTGRVITDGKVTSLTKMANELADVIEVNHKGSVGVNCKRLSHDLFRPEIAATQVEAALGD